MTEPPGVILRAPHEADRAAFTEGVRASERLHDPWLDPGEPEAWFDRLLARNRTETDRSLLVCTTDDWAGGGGAREGAGGDGGLAGVYNLSQIFHGHFGNAYLGYYALEPYAGRGLMRAGLDLLLDHAFGELELHRVQVNIQPENAASVALVKRAGFRREGFSPRYLRIRDEWRDHEQWAMTVEDRPDSGSGPT
jgi:[ribosomal protein S5]-alanine N-acetyltransferase